MQRPSRSPVLARRFRCRRRQAGRAVDRLGDAAGSARSPLADLPGIIDYRPVEQAYAESNGLTGRIVNWQNDGASTRRGLAASRSAGAVIQHASDDTFVRLTPTTGVPAYLPSLVSVASAPRLADGVVTATELAGERLTATTTALDFRQYLMAESDDPLTRAVHRRPVT